MPLWGVTDPILQLIFDSLVCLLKKERKNALAAEATEHGELQEAKNRQHIPLQVKFHGDFTGRQKNF